MNTISRHLLATIAFRFQKAVHGTSLQFAQLSVGQGIRSPLEIVTHMSNVLEYARSRMADTPRIPQEPLSWQGEINRFHEILFTLDEILEKNPIEEALLLRLTQGPFSDVLTHVGQLAMLRRMNHDPIPGARYTEANIVIGKVGPQQDV